MLRALHAKAGTRWRALRQPRRRPTAAAQPPALVLAAARMDLCRIGGARSLISRMGDALVSRLRIGLAAALRLALGELLLALLALLLLPLGAELLVVGGRCLGLELAGLLERHAVALAL